jgi:hypothetical protein
MDRHEIVLRVELVRLDLPFGLWSVYAIAMSQANPLHRNEIDRAVSASDWVLSPQTRNVEHQYLTKRPQLLHANTFHRHPATYSTVRRRHSALQQSGLTTSNHGSPSHDDVNAHRVPYSDAFHATQRGFHHPLEHARLPSGRLPLLSVTASHSSLFGLATTVLLLYVQRLAHAGLVPARCTQYVEVLNPTYITACRTHRNSITVPISLAGVV